MLKAKSRVGDVLGRCTDCERFTMGSLNRKNNLVWEIITFHSAVIIFDVRCVFCPSEIMVVLMAEMKLLTC